METLEPVRYLLALAFVLGLIALAAWLAGRLRLGGRGAGPGRRLRVVEVTTLDPRRRLALIRRDDVEHVVLFGPDGAIVVERAIPAPPSTTTSSPP